MRSVIRGSKAVRLLLLVDSQVMAIGVYRGARGLHLRPPSEHGKCEQPSRACQTFDQGRHEGRRLFYVMRHFALSSQNHAPVIQGLLTCRLGGHNREQRLFAAVKI
ncbi:hypothetical protein X777_05802 [Ooceraea biroi]|uniref:Secreted protein n=1 Tax=Ooceraea biroi TaxID=2015173 RepID=A0A026WG01_OOCBI|nr:hypothetical protein X777_05802 [Ooceraea biroi]